MGKKGVTMSLFEANSKFGGDAASQMLPSQSEGKDFGKSKGKGLRDNTGDLDDWRTPGERKGKGRGKGDERSRADDGDWFSKDRPAGGGGDRGGGDRGGGGGGGFRRDGDRGRDDNTQANKDDDWRSGMGSRGGGGGGDDDRGGGRGGFGNRDRDGGGGGGRGGFGNRDRDGGGGRDDDLSSWRRDKQESSGPSERPKLNLKPKSGGADATPTGGGDKPSRPWDKKDDQEDDDATPAADEKKPTKYVPPGQRKAMEEEEKKKDQRKKEEDERRAKNQEKMQKEEEEKNRRRSEAQRKQDEIAEKRRKELEEVEEKKRRIEEEKQAAERARKNALKLEKEAEAKEKREAVMRASQEKKNAAKGPTSAQGGAEVKVECNTEKVESFGEKCEALVKGSGNVDTFVKKEVDDILTPDELGTVQPMARLLEVLLTYCRGKKDKEVIDVVAKFAPLLNCLISSSGVRRFKVKVLIEAQRIASKMGLPRLSPASALLEIFFDGLYSAEVIEEAYFEMWAVSNDDTPGKTSAMFQVNFFLDWLRKAKLDGEESSEEEEEDKEGSEEEDEDDDEEVDDDDDDIMANVPRGRGR